MTNLLEETKSKIEDLGLSVDDVEWVGSKDGEYAITWKEFEVIADIEYDEGFGAQEIANDLVVVFKDGSYLSRQEYDGSEWWEDHSSHTSPTKLENPKTFSYVKTFFNGWFSLKTIMKDAEQNHE